MFYYNQTPTAHIAVNKNRQKVYAGDKIFLKDGTEFEIELFNPTQDVVLAKFLINGEYESRNGLVLNPGVRVFLERPLQSDKRFKFETYEVERNNEEVQRAIIQNGKIIIEFYKEEKKPQYYNPYPKTCDVRYGPINEVSTDNIRFSSGTTTTGNPNYTHTSFTTNIGDTATYTTSYAADINLTGSATADSLSFTNISNTIDTPEVNVKSSNMETGRIEQGSKSDQSFRYINKDFEIFTFHTIQYNLLPESEFNVHVQDIKVYCTDCGARRRKDNWKFCPKCGAKYD